MCRSESMRERKISCFQFRESFKSKKNMSKKLNGCVVYHEKQIKELCALHALNNLFQKPESFTKAQLDRICHTLSPDVWINPHKSLLGLGNYDINVIMKALQSKGCEAIWFDKRKDPGCLDLNNISGFILNVPSDYRLGFVLLPLRRRHWITLRQIGGNFYNLDSKLDAPQLIGRGSDLITYLKEQLDCRDKELFLVVTSDVERNQSWQIAGVPSDRYSMNHIDDIDGMDRDAECIKLSDISPCDFESSEVSVTINPLCARTSSDPALQ